MLYPSKGRKFIPYIKKNVHHAPIFVFSELLNVAAIFVSHLAISRGPVSLVKVIGGVQPVYILLISLVLFPFFPRYFRKSEKLPLKSLLLFMILLGLWLMS
jgi:drug/metabolite transporter (DMT)-like permease